MAKGWLLGLQFQVMFRDGLYYRLAEHANEQSRKIYAVLEECRIPMFAEAVSNQLFPIFPWSFIMELAQNFSFEIIEKIDADKAVIRLCNFIGTQQIMMLKSFVPGFANFKLNKE